MVRGSRGYTTGGSRGSMGGGRGGGYRGSNSSYYNNRSAAGTGSRSGGNFSGRTSSSYNRGYGSSSYDNYKSRDDRNRHSDRDHKRTYVGARDRSPDRKRSRHEDSRLNSSYSSSSYRRGETSSRSNRQTPPPPAISSVSRVSSTYRSSRRDDSTHHRSSLGSRRPNDSMGPPKGIPPRNNRIMPRTRGIVNRLRGTNGRPAYVSRVFNNRRDASDMNIMRKRLLIANQRDRVRRIKIAKLTSSLRKRREADKSSRRISSKSSSHRSHEKSSKTDDEDDDDGGRSKSKSVSGDTIKKKSAAKVKSDNKDGDSEDAAEVEDSAEKDNSKKGEEIEKDIEEDEAGDKSTEKDEKADDAATSDKETDKNEKKKKEQEKSKSKSKKTDHHRRSKSKSPRKQLRRSSYIKLTCVHCRMKCLSFQDYTNHLYLRVHQIAMRRLALRQKAQLSAMRLQQRNTQREIEKNLKEDLDDCKPQFCLLCRLHYRQPKAKHQLSEHHRNMKKFLMPYCATCHLAFKSPMMYESHRCSLDHIKRKARNNEAHSDNSGDEREVDLANFMTVDSVGEVDYHDDEDRDEEVTGDDDKEKVNVGADHVKKTKAFYCDLCRMYFPLKDDEESVIKKHCSMRSHLQAFLRYKEDQDLQAQAERVQRKECKDSKKKDDSGSKAENKVKKTIENGDNDEEEIVEDKLWEDVDKDLGDLLREVGPEEEEEEDESVLNLDTERFDKFKNSEKNKKELNGNVENETKEAESTADESKTSKIKEEVAVDDQKVATEAN